MLPLLPFDWVARDALVTDDNHASLAVHGGGVRRRSYDWKTAGPAAPLDDGMAVGASPRATRAFEMAALVALGMKRQDCDAAAAQGEMLAENTSPLLLVSGVTRSDASESNARSDGVGSAAVPLKDSDERMSKPALACCPELLTLTRTV